MTFSKLLTGRFGLATLLVVAFVGLFLSLGFWQLDRAAYKASLEKTLETNRALGALTLTSADIERLIDDPSAWQYRRVILHGHYDQRYVVYLDNRVHKGVAGYFVLTPFVIANDQRLMVNRGWMAAGDRQQLPAIDTSTDEQAITVSLSPIAEDSFTLGDIQDSALWPQRWTHVNTQIVAAALPYSVLPVTGQLEGRDQGSALVQLDVEFGNTWVARHKGYALQWFLMALVLLVLYVRLIWKSR